jgi:hypothetical protein
MCTFLIYCLLHFIYVVCVAPLLLVLGLVLMHRPVCLRKHGRLRCHGPQPKHRDQPEPWVNADKYLKGEDRQDVYSFDISEHWTSSLYKTVTHRYEHEQSVRTVTRNGVALCPPVSISSEVHLTYKGQKVAFHSISKSGPHQATFCVFEQTWCPCWVWTTVKTPRSLPPTTWIHADTWRQKHTHTHTHTHTYTELSIRQLLYLCYI